MHDAKFPYRKKIQINGFKEEYLAKEFIVFLNNVAGCLISEWGTMVLFTEKYRPKSNRRFKEKENPAIYCILYIL